MSVVVETAQSPGIHNAVPRPAGAAADLEPAVKMVRQLFLAINESIEKKGAHVNHVVKANGVTASGVVFEPAVEKVRPLEGKLLQDLLGVRDPLLQLPNDSVLQLPNDSIERALMRITAYITHRYSELESELTWRCDGHPVLRKLFWHLPSALSFDRDHSYDCYLDLLYRGHSHPEKGRHCWWKGIIALDARLSKTNGALIVSKPCDECESSTSKADGHDDVYNSELAALSLLLCRMLPRRNADLADRPDDAKPTAMVINMTPTEVRVLQAVVHDRSRRTVTVSKLVSFAHDCSSHNAKQPEDQWFGCKGCQQVVSWLFFGAVGSGADLSPETGNSASPVRNSAVVATGGVSTGISSRNVSGGSDKTTSSDKTDQTDKTTSSVCTDISSVADQEPSNTTSYKDTRDM